MPDDGWKDRGACKGFDKTEPDLMWPTPATPPREINRAKAICATCPVQPECLTAGLGEHHGIWGGTTPRERRKLRRQIQAGAS